jgi:nickel/cobalt tolerance cation efflux system protein
VVVLGGLITSTALTLLVIPALYARFSRWLLPAPQLSSLSADL